MVNLSGVINYLKSGKTADIIKKLWANKAYPPKPVTPTPSNPTPSADVAKDLTINLKNNPSSNVSTPPPGLQQAADAEMAVAKSVAMKSAAAKAAAAKSTLGKAASALASPSAVGSGSLLAPIAAGIAGAGAIQYTFNKLRNEIADQSSSNTSNYDQMIKLLQKQKGRNTYVPKPEPTTEELTKKVNSRIPINKNVDYSNMPQSMETKFRNSGGRTL